MSSAAVGTHSGAGPLSLMSCVRESSPLQDFDSDTEKNVATKKKFWNRIKWFKRKNKVIEDSVLPVSDYIPTSDSLRSRSTSELSIEEPPRKRNGSSMYPGLSVSHDSVFHSPHSGSVADLDATHSSSSLSISNQPQSDLQTELSERLRLRRSGAGRGDTSEDDEGLPHSPCNSPTTTDSLDKTVLKDLPNKSHSTCSDGSLLSVGSSDIEEDLLLGQYRYSSKFSSSENKQDFDLNSPSLPLNHSAAHHRAKVRPKKTHAVPNRKRIQQLPNTLPTTIEVNEDSSVRSASPENNPKDNAIELCNTSGYHTPLTESQLKSSSLPLGLVAPGSDNKLNRSKSNAGSKSQDALEDNHEKGEKCDRSFFDRLFPRRSAKKKKAKHDEKKLEEKKMKIEELSAKYDDKRKNEESFSAYSKHSESSYRRYESKPIPAVRSGAAYRQRVLPIDIPDSPETFRKEDEVVAAKSPLPDILSTSPLQIELENKLKQRLTVSSPQKSFEVSEDQPEVLEPSTERRSPKSPTRKIDDSKSKMKLAGLSSLQQKVLTLNEDEDDYHSFKSLTEFPSSQQKNNVLLTKSHSFKSATSNSIQNTSTTAVFTNRNSETTEGPIGKSSSLDSVKVFDEKIERTKVETFSEKIEHRRQFKQQTKEFKCDITVNEGENLNDRIAKCISENKMGDSYADKNHITISGPSHTAIVNVKNNEDFFSITTEDVQTKVEMGEKREQSISITKINVHPENEQNVLEAKPLLPKSAKITSKPIFNFDLDKEAKVPRKFSRDDVEIIDKDGEDVDKPKTSPVYTVTTPLFKKNEKGTPKKSSMILITPESPTRDKSITSCKSSSLDSLVSDHLDSTDRSSQDSLDKHSVPKPDGVVLRKKSSVKETKDEEPELMKVFARRSLKLKDTDNENLNQQLSVMLNENCDKTRDSDKENQTDSPVKERKKSTHKENVKIENANNKTEMEVQQRKKSVSKSDDENQEKDNESKKKPTVFEVERKDKEPLGESNVVHSKPIPIKNPRTETSQENSEVMLRKTTDSSYQRSVSINNTKIIDNSQNILRKQFISRRKTDNWITNMKNEQSEKEKEIVKDEELSSKEESNTELIIEPKNFNQRKAEWEKRAQEAQKKSTP